MKKIRNKKTKVVKVPKSEVELSMYLATNEWELVKEEKPKFNVPKSEEK